PTAVEVWRHPITASVSEGLSICRRADPQSGLVAWGVAPRVRHARMPWPVRCRRFSHVRSWRSGVEGSDRDVFRILETRYRVLRPARGHEHEGLLAGEQARLRARGA